MKYCAFLRGVNVKGTSMKMEEVGKVFENVGMEDVSWVLATGNILFSSQKNREDLKMILQEALSQYFKYEAFLFLKNEQEIKQIYHHLPFEKQENCHQYIFITLDGFENTLLKEFLSSEHSDLEEGAIIEGTFYWKIEKGNTLDSNFGKILGKKAFKDKITSRNSTTFEKIIKKFNS